MIHRNSQTDKASTCNENVIYSRSPYNLLVHPSGNIQTKEERRLYFVFYWLLQASMPPVLEESI